MLVALSCIENLYEHTTHTNIYKKKTATGIRTTHTHQWRIYWEGGRVPLPLFFGF